MGPLTTHSADHPSTSDQTTGRRSDLEIRPPALEDGAAMWRIARDTGTLDLNTSYAYLLMAHDFGATSRLALSDGAPVGFVLGYRRPSAPETLFVWQIGVDSSQRGKGVAGQLLDDLLAGLPEVTALETTITEDNTASQRLFASFAQRHGAREDVRELITEGHFPDPGHGAELLHVIGPLRRET
ncbi:diaminobutyrate acetyltransferase [Brachybacterium saurashtrense]|uniref:L-2,4-diaminobutyric acid acetyltransferase n=2 Tax=Brachybacterium saurashtrense TaxID=556288 RepID=A0A345YPP4_9MICO|nr:diaminobutyrate acetyltransferase [Brachybacterium saurashtrense]RRR24915.1 diaminobutyrate acetyltransferase [Brachybacterium saurashtrense]